MDAAIGQSPLPTQAEFHAAITRRSDRWFSACLRITRSRELAEDAVQEALLSAWNKRAQFQHGATLETWIHRIAVNAALQLIRKQRPTMFHSLDVEVAAEDRSPEAIVADVSLGNALSTALEKLTEIERVCFVLKHLEQWRLAEIADELGSNVSSVKQAIFRAVKKLRISMTDMKSTAS